MAGTTHTTTSDENSILDADAYLLDVDGTLIDSNYLHVMAWQHALRDAGEDATAARIHRAIGLDSEKLLDAVVPQASSSERERILSLHTKHYADFAPQLRTLPGARELLRELHARGIRVVLATSAPQDEVDRQLATLDADDWIDEVTTGEDVDTAKPEPDVFQAAMKRAGVTADRCLVVGDARWDVIAARKAGVRAIGVETGGTAECELIDAGAVVVYGTAQDIVDRLSGAPRSGA